MDQFKKIIHKKNTEIGSLRAKLGNAERKIKDLEFLLAKSENDFLMMQPMLRDGIISKDDALDAMRYVIEPIKIDAALWGQSERVIKDAKDSVSYAMQVPKEYLENKNKSEVSNMMDAVSDSMQEASDHIKKPGSIGISSDDKKPPYFDLDD